MGNTESNTESKRLSPATSTTILINQTQTQAVESSGVDPVRSSNLGRPNNRGNFRGRGRGRGSSGYLNQNQRGPYLPVPHTPSFFNEPNPQPTKEPSPQPRLSYPSQSEAVADHPPQPSGTTEIKKSNEMASLQAMEEELKKQMKNLKLTKKKEINILLLGETGVGKSTFINAIFNYLQYEDFTKAEKDELNVLIPSTITLFDKNNQAKRIDVGSREDANEHSEVGSSATQGVKTYSFHIKNGEVLVRLIDTPGMGDTRGIEQDSLNCEDILNYISRLHELHAICYLCKPQQARATAYFKYCIAQIMSRLEKSACKNFVFVFTHSRGSNFSPGETFELLKQMAEEIGKNPAQAKIPIEENRFCFDNVAFRYLAGVKNGVEFHDWERTTSIQSWKKSTGECWRMIEYILSLSPHHVQNTAAVNEARRIIYQLSKPMADIAQLVNDNVYILQNHESTLDLNKKSYEELKKQLHIPVIELQVTNLTQPVTVCTAPKCSEVYKVGEVNEMHYKTRCHDPCYLNNVPKEMIGTPELMNCASMGPNQICNKCSCSYRLHMHVYYMTKKTHTRKIDELVASRFNKKEHEIENVKRIIEQVKERKQKLEDELNVIVRCNAKFAHFLQNNAIAPFSDAYEEYINYLIIREKSMGSQADYNRVAGLERLVREHLEMKKVFAEAAEMQKKLGNSDNVTPQEITKSMNQLFKLELNGQKIKELYDTQKKSIKKEFGRTEYVHQGVFAKSPEKSKTQTKDNSLGKEKQGKSSNANPTTKFQRGRPNNRGNFQNQRGRSSSVHRNQNERGPYRPRSPPPPYYGPNEQPAREPPPQHYSGYTRQSEGAAYHPPPPSAPQKNDDKSPTIQVNVTLPKDEAGNPPRNDYPGAASGPHHSDPYRPREYGDYRDPRDYYNPPHPRDYPPHPRDYPPHPRDYPPHPRDYPPHPRDYPPPPRDYPPHPRDYPPHPRDYPAPPRDYPPHPRDYYHYPPTDPHYHRDPHYDPRGQPGSSSYHPPPPPPPGAYPNNPPPPQHDHFNQSRPERPRNDRANDNFRGNRGQGFKNRGGVTRKHYKKRNNQNNDNTSGNDSDTSSYSAK